MKLLIGILIAAIVLVVAGTWYVSQPKGSSPSTKYMPTATALVPASPVVVPGISAAPAAGIPAVESTTLAAVGAYQGTGVATRGFAGTTFTHSVTATLPDPVPGMFYEGWLVGAPGFFSTGKMTKQGNSYVLTYTAQQNYPTHNLVVITEETLSQGLDGISEAHVLEGSFK